jgi:hypothetical protein
VTTAARLLVLVLLVLLPAGLPNSCVCPLLQRPNLPISVKASQLSHSRAA